nr:PREDICTED: prostatic acid phosphatase-like [Bemisia tabaci]
MYRGTRNSILQYCEPPKRGTFSMVTVLGFAIATIFLAYLSFGSSPKAEPTLRFVSIVHRHGERVPTFTYPLDPFQNESFWSEGKGQLMNIGKLNIYELGKFLRSRYDGFIPAKYKSSHIHVRSTYADRCIMSAQVLLAGLYPPVDSQIWNKDLLWQPIPVHSVPRNMDNVLICGTTPCPLFVKEKAAVVNSSIQKMMDEHRQLIDHLSKMTGVEMKSVMDIELLYDNLLIAEEQGYKLPEWTHGIYPDKLKPFAMASLSVFSETPTLKKLCSGLLIHEIITNMKNKTSSADFDRLLTLYSAHDLTVLSLWRSLGVVQEVPKPNYGATFIIELHQMSNKYFVKLLYKNHALDKELTVLNIEGCDSVHDGMCDLDHFATALKSVSISNYDQECNK